MTDCTLTNYIPSKESILKLNKAIGINLNEETKSNYFTGIYEY